MQGMCNHAAIWPSAGVSPAFRGGGEDATERAWSADAPMMNVLEVCCERSETNYRALLEALTELEATSREDSTKISTAMLETQDIVRLDTVAGALNCIAVPAGTNGYADLSPNAVAVNVGDDFTFRIASVADLVRIARAAGGPFDLAAIETSPP